MRGIRHAATILAVLALFACDKGSEIDHYVLALSWQPAFCESNRDRPECQHLDKSDLAAGHLTLHGLWPNDKPGAGPTYCGVEPATRDLDAPQSWCELPEPVLSPQTRELLTPRMPGTESCLDRHEWIKHGTCAGTNADRYFGSALRLTEAIDQLRMSKLIGESVGRYVNRQQLIAAFEEAFRAGSAKAITFRCAEKGADSYLLEIRIALRPSALDGTLERGDLYLDGPPPAGNCPATIRIDRAG